MTAILLLAIAGLLVLHAYRGRIKRWWRNVTRRALSGAAPVLALQVGVLWLGARADTAVTPQAVVAIPFLLLLALQVRSA